LTAAGTHNIFRLSEKQVKNQAAIIMTASNNKPANANAVFQLKGSLFTLTVLHLLQADLTALAEQLKQAIQQAPRFFQHMPIIIDLQKLAGAETALDFSGLINALRAQNVIPIGIRGGNAQQQTAAVTMGMAVFSNTKADPLEINAAPTSKIAPAVATPAAATTASHFSRIITQPVRSGQQIYARNSDLIVLASVSAGAELIADGNIHIYGALRGRALAGVSGNVEARVFCQSLEAELVSIAGHYWLHEDLQTNPLKQHVQIYLDNDRLQISAF
jgi:septum site-determining protein MinC